jgi:ribonuclease HI
MSNSKLFKATTYQLCMCSATTTFRWIKGHTGNKENKQAGKLAGMGA